jgi:hypothetical protein
MPWLAAQAINSLKRGDTATPRRWIHYRFGICLLFWLLRGPGGC